MIRKELLRTDADWEAWCKSQRAYRVFLHGPPAPPSLPCVIVSCRIPGRSVATVGDDVEYLFVTWEDVAAVT